MDRSGDIRLDPDVIEYESVSQVPLSDLYELPVFSYDCEQKARERRMKEEKMLKRIRRCVFEANGQEEEEWLREISSQIFKTSTEIVMPDGYHAAEKVSQTGGYSVIVMAGFFLLLFGIRKLFRLRA